MDTVKVLTEAGDLILQIQRVAVGICDQKHLDVRGCWGSDYSHFHRGVDILRMPAAADLWSGIKLDSYRLSQANEALAEVEAGRAIKALILPEP